MKMHLVGFPETRKILDLKQPDRHDVEAAGSVVDKLSKLIKINKRLFVLNLIFRYIFLVFIVLYGYDNSY